jgi:hypothetical protein
MDFFFGEWRGGFLRQRVAYRGLIPMAYVMQCHVLRRSPLGYYVFTYFIWDAASMGT